MDDVLKSGRKARHGEADIPAALREFIDTVIVPQLVKEYLAETENPNLLVLPDDAVANSATKELSSYEVSR
jgi:hypothetical protein